jgi:hypothetical protein
MKPAKLVLSSAVVVLGLGLPLMAQRTAPGEQGDGATDRSAGGGGVTSRGISAGDFSASSAPVGRMDAGNLGMSHPTSGVTFSRPTPNLVGTSWLTSNSYYQWSSFLYQLQSRYMLDGSYFTRFTRNVEPLVTPQMMKLALNEPLSYSGRLVRAAADLEALVGTLQTGSGSVSGSEIAAKAREVRELARKIRQDPSLTYVDKRLPKTVSGDVEQQGLDAARELRALATELHGQLKTMYTQTSTSTVSVRALEQPSFETLSKKIEKLSKAIESAAKHS